MTTPLSEETEVGSYFISNYPPFSLWRQDVVSCVPEVLGATPPDDVPIGLYLHIPFCRKRCKFCYFRVYTDKNSKQVESYMAALSREVELYSQHPVLASRPFRFAYFGGGTPSFLSEKQLSSLVDRLRRFVNWDDAEEVTFECEPGTLTARKLKTIREIGVTRLSLGVENFDDQILEDNGRAHRSPEVLAAYDWARDAGFPHINIDLIAGMVGETEENWHSCIQKALDLSPDSLTVYQMELPYNAVYADSLQGGELTVADWKTKRRWVRETFEAFEQAGYHVSSAYTMVKDPDVGFVYRDALWHGADMLGTGVASFSHVGGVHFQNIDGLDPYVECLDRGELPLGRALKVTPHQLLIRELILQLKLGRITPSYFANKFDTDIRVEFRTQLAELQNRGFLEDEGEQLRLHREGLLRVDSLLPAFFESEHQGARYT